MNTLEELTQTILKFRNERDWEQFHTRKDAAMALSLEASEVLEHFLWKTPEEITEYLKDHTVNVSEELADVLFWVLLISHDLNIDLKQAFERKMEINKQKYPVEKAKGKHTKYTELT